MAGKCVEHCGQRLLHVITRAKDNTVGYTGPPPETGKRGQGKPPVWGKKVKLWKQFRNANEF